MRRHPVLLSIAQINHRSHIGLALRAWKRAIASELGGPDNLTTAQKTILETASRTKVFLDHIDTWLLMQGTVADSEMRRWAMDTRQELERALRREMDLLRVRPPGGRKRMASR